MKVIVRKAFPPFVLLVFVSAAVEYVVSQGIVASYLLPAPSSVFKTLVADFPEYVEATKMTLAAAVLGLIASTILGVTFAIALSSSRLLERAIYPYAIFFQTVPLIAIAPILVIWFGFGLSTVVVSAFIVSIFPVIANTLAGMNTPAPSLRDLFKLYGAKRSEVIFKLQLPSAVPQIYIGIKIATGLSLIGAIVGEMIAGGGLGGLVDIARTQQRIDKVFAAVLLASFSGIFLVAALNVMRLVFLSRWQLNDRS
jgi:NitT/TauT family transport system permease protein